VKSAKNQIAEHFGIGPRHVFNLTRQRVLPYSKLGRAVRYDLGACDRAIKKLERKSRLLMDEDNAERRIETGF
jgi:hypothetical protein